MRGGARKGGVARSEAPVRYEVCAWPAPSDAGSRRTACADGALSYHEGLSLGGVPEGGRTVEKQRGMLKAQAEKRWPSNREEVSTWASQT